MCLLVYGKNQKGYRCYDPETRTLYTTMNCDFVEGEYFYNQSESQGENNSDKPKDDSLDWLPSYNQTHTSDLRETNQGGEACRDICEENEENQNHPSDPDLVTKVSPSETVIGTNEALIPAIQNKALSNIPELPDPLSDPEVTSSDCISVPQDSTDIVTNVHEDETIQNSEERRSDRDARQYELPSRSTRGVPPKRYSPDWKGRKTRYSVASLAQEQLTEMARAFETALYEEEEIPQSAQEAMRHRHWREAMK